jgi:glucokinase
LAEAGRAVDGGDAVKAAKAGDQEAIEALRTLGERLGIGVANALNTFDPDEVVIGGGVSVAGDLLLGPAVEVAWRFALPGVGERTEIRLARHGREAGVRGAALLAGLELAEEGNAFVAPRPEVERA